MHCLTKLTAHSRHMEMKLQSWPKTAKCNPVTIYHGTHSSLPKPFTAPKMLKKKVTRRTRSRMDEITYVTSAATVILLELSGTLLDITHKLGGRFVLTFITYKCSHFA